MKRKNIMILMISLSLVLLLGSSYALLRSTQVGTNPYVINVGTLQVTFVDSETEFLNLTDMYPMSDKEGSSQDKELSFMVKNTGNVDSYYDVTLEETSTNPEFKSVIRYIINNDDKGYNEPKTLGENKYIEVGGYLKPNESSSYKVKIWLDYNADNNYMDKTFTAKVAINSFQESEYAKDVIKSKLVKYSESSKDDFTGGLVAINTNGELYNETDFNQKIREYRYSGPTVNNYVTFNDELWRIIGVFEEENEEFVKIVSNKLLESDKIPFNYQISNTNYIIKTKEPFDYSQGVYWNKIEDGNAKLDWTTSGLQYYLNTETDESVENKGYFNYLSSVSKTMIRESNYYLGNIHIDATNSFSNYDNTILAYTHERDESNIFSDQKSRWTGKVALMYPSDVGYANLSKNWNLKLHVMLNQKNYNWMYNTMEDILNNGNWLISRGDATWAAMILGRSGSLGTSNYTKLDSLDDVYQTSFMYDYNVRPALYLKSNVKITSGDGTSDSPYVLTIN